MRVILSPKARRCLDRIYQYYKDKSLGMHGRKIRAKIMSKAMRLREGSTLGQEEETLKHLGLGIRYLVEGNYKILYVADGNDIFIITVFDTRQDPGKMLD